MNVLCRGLQGKISLLNGDCRRMYTCIDGPVVRGKGVCGRKGLVRMRAALTGKAIRDFLYTSCCA